jgi:hypothetical protein
MPGETRTIHRASERCALELTVERPPANVQESGLSPLQRSIDEADTIMTTSMYNRPHPTGYIQSMRRNNRNRNLKTSSIPARW